MEGRCILVFLFLCLHGTVLSQQTEWRKIVGQAKADFDEQLYGSTNSLLRSKSTNYQRLLKFSDEGNSYHFMHLGPMIDALTIMYENTSDEEYLKSADKIITNVLAKSQRNPQSYLSWKAYSKDPAYKTVNGKEWKIFEAHFFRYVAAYLYVISKNKGNIKEDSIMKNGERYLAFLEKNVWEKWYVKYGKRIDSFLGSRTHMGAQWAQIALYLSRVTQNSETKSRYLEYLKLFNSRLKNNLKTEDGAYVWKSNWNDGRTIIQDVAHANHVIEYIVSAYELKSGWDREDLEAFSRTFVRFIYDDSSNKVYSNIDGTGKLKFVNLSDGWMKLARFNGELNNQIQQYIAANYKDVASGPFSLQYFAVAMNL